MKGGAKETALAFCFVQSHAPTDGPETGEAAPPVKLAGPPAPDVVLWSSVAAFFFPISHFSLFFGGGVWGSGCRCGMIGMWLWLWHVLVVTPCLLLLLVSSLQGTNAGECRAGGSWATCKHRHGHRSFLFGDGAGAAQDM